MAASKHASPADLVDFDQKMMEDIGFLTSMNLVLLGNYAQTGHFGGPLSYTPCNVSLHLGLPENGGLSYDIRDPKHAFTDKFMLTGGHCIPTCYSLWMILYEAMDRAHKATGNDAYKCNPAHGMYAIDALGFRRGPDAVKTLLADNGLADHELFAQAKIRGIRALMGHSETTDVTNDVNGGPSGVGFANTAGKAVFWDYVGAPESLKIWALEGEFAMTEGHAQELKTIALAQQVGKRLRLFLSNNNAGIDDSLIGGVIREQYTGYDLVAQWTSYGWNVVELDDGADYAKLLATFKTLEDWPAADRRPMAVIAKTVKGWWPTAKDGRISDTTAQVVSYASHPYGMAMNSPYFLALAASFEKHFGVEFVGIRSGVPANERERLIQFKQNVDICLSVLDAADGRIRNWIANRLLAIADRFAAAKTVFASSLRFPAAPADPFNDPRLKVANLPIEPQSVEFRHPLTGAVTKAKISLFLPPGENKGTRRAISEYGRWMNYVTGNRYMTIAADLSGSINLEASHFTGHYDPVTNPLGTRLKAGIQEAANAATACGIASQNLSPDPSVFNGLHCACGTYGAFTPLFYTPLRIFSQQNQESPFKLGVVTIVVGHSGPETAADARSHFGIFAPHVWRLFPRNHIVNIYCADYNDVCPAYFGALEMCQTRHETAIIAVHVARPDVKVFDRSTFADTDIKAAARGCYVIREAAPDAPPCGTIVVQGSSATVNLVSLIPRLVAAGLNVRIVAAISQELFDAQSDEYRARVMPPSAYLDSTFITTMTKTVHPIAGLGPLAEEFSLGSDWDDRWRTGGLEPDVIAEAHLDSEHIFEAIQRFVVAREARLARMRAALA
eukprot:c18376_g1_i2.p2 GENE.c18376_g1_i2~~c18376_g1_i2.p2  ORF type:complete len:854 (+),score=167.72 c18376_g1_i2:34-2562(+)